MKQRFDMFRQKVKTKKQHTKINSSELFGYDKKLSDELTKKQRKKNPRWKKISKHKKRNDSTTILLSNNEFNRPDIDRIWVNGEKEAKKRRKNNIKNKLKKSKAHVSRKLRKDGSKIAIKGGFMGVSAAIFLPSLVPLSLALATKMVVGKVNRSIKEKQSQNRVFKGGKDELGQGFESHLELHDFKKFSQSVNDYTTVGRNKGLSDLYKIFYSVNKEARECMLTNVDPYTKLRTPNERVKIKLDALYRLDEIAVKKAQFKYLSKKLDKAIPVQQHLDNMLQEVNSLISRCVSKTYENKHNYHNPFEDSPLRNFIYKTSKGIEKAYKNSTKDPRIGTSKIVSKVGSEVIDKTINTVVSGGLSLAEAISLFVAGEIKDNIQKKSSDELVEKMKSNQGKEFSDYLYHFETELKRTDKKIAALLGPLMGKLAEMNKKIMKHGRTYTMSKQYAIDKGKIKTAQDIIERQVNRVHDMVEFLKDIKKQADVNVEKGEKLAEEILNETYGKYMGQKLSNNKVSRKKELKAKLNQSITNNIDEQVELANEDVNDNQTTSYFKI